MCDDENPCTDDTCDPQVAGGCVCTANAEPCDDDNPCTNVDVCATGTCAGSPVDCTLIDGECGFGLCDPSTGTCVLSPSNDGGTCDDGAACTEGDVCGRGSCGGPPVAGSLHELRVA